LIAPPALAAQLCRGVTPLAGVSFANVSAGASFFEGGRTIGGAATAGASLFGSGSFARDAYVNPEGQHRDVVGGALGYEVTPADGPVSVCPILGGAYTYGYEVLGSELTSVAISASLGVGYLTEVEPSVSVISSVELSLVRDAQSVDLGVSGTAKHDDTYGVLTFSLGFLVSRRRAVIAPVVRIPLASDDGSVGAGASVAFAIGGDR